MPLAYTIGADGKQIAPRASPRGVAIGVLHAVLGELVRHHLEHELTTARERHPG